MKIFFYAVVVLFLLSNNTITAQDFTAKLRKAESIRDSSPQESSRLLHEILQADSLKVPLLDRAKALQLLALSEMYNNQFAKAKAYFRRSEVLLDYASPSDEIKNMRASLFMDIGRSFTWQAKYDSALYNILLAKELYGETGDKKGLAVTLNAIAIIYGQFNEDYAAALKAFQEALYINKQLNDSLSMAKVMQNIGQVYELTGQLDSALYYLQVSNSLSRKFKDFRSLAIGSNILGAVFFARDELDSSEFYYRQAINLDVQNQDSVGLVLDYHMLSLTLIKKKKYSEALHYSLSAFRNAKDLGVKYETADNISQIYEQTHNYKKALEFHQEYKKLEDSLRSVDQREIISELQAKYDTEKKEQQIALLDQKNKLASAQLATAEKEKWYYLLISLLILVAAVAIFFFYRQSKKSQRLLAEKNKQLSQLNATKDRLFGVVAHDLKNPLSAFSSITQSLIDNHAHISEADLKYFLERLFKSSRELNGLLQNLLEWSMSQSGELSFDPQQVSVKKAVAEALQPQQLSADIKHLTVEVDIEDNTGVYADPRMIVTVLRNLLSNAIKFTPERGTVKVSVSSMQEKAAITVADTGIGMEARHVESLFHYGTDYRKIGESTEKGTGLGLVLCKELIGRQGGDISVCSTPGQGSSFTITLPKAKLPDSIPVAV